MTSCMRLQEIPQVRTNSYFACFISCVWFLLLAYTETLCMSERRFGLSPKTLQILFNFTFTSIKWQKLHPSFPHQASLCQNLITSEDVPHRGSLYDHSNSISSSWSHCRTVCQEGWVFLLRGGTCKCFLLLCNESRTEAHSRLMIAVSWTFDDFKKQTDWKNGQNNGNEWGNAISKHSSYIAKAADDSWALAKSFDHLFKLN